MVTVVPTYSLERSWLFDVLTNTGPGGLWKTFITLFLLLVLEVNWPLIQDQNLGLALELLCEGCCAIENTLGFPVGCWSSCRQTSRRSNSSVLSSLNWQTSPMKIFWLDTKIMKGVIWRPEMRSLQQPIGWDGGFACIEVKKEKRIEVHECRGKTIQRWKCYQWIPKPRDNLLVIVWLPGLLSRSHDVWRVGIRAEGTLAPTDLKLHCSPQLKQSDWNACSAYKCSSRWG